MKNININAQVGMDWSNWYLPIGFSIYSGKYDSELVTSPNGHVEFVKKETMGWYAYPTFRFLCFYLHIEFDYWYRGKTNGKSIAT